MACDELASSLSQSARPAGALTQSDRPASDGFCRTFSFPAYTPPATGFVTFAGDPMVTFAGDAIAPF